MDTIFFCQHCGDAAVLGEHGLEMVEGTALMPAAGRSAEVWRPAWSIEAQVTVADRIRSGGFPTQGWEDRKTFIVPAFELPLDDLTRLVRALAAGQEAYREVPREPIRGGALAIEDALTIVRHVLIGDEVRRSDMLASVRVEVEMLARRLVAMPLERAGEGLRCAVTGVTVRTREG
jgi:hypothetical protein